MTCGGNSPRDYGAVVAGSRPLGDGTVLLAVSCPEIAGAAEPGQFVMVRPGPGNDPFLGRPLAVADVAGDIFKMVCRIAGTGTAFLAAKRQGDSMIVRGPVGTGFFSSLEGAPLPKKVILAGGSVGAAPLLFAARRLGKEGIGPVRPPRRDSRRNGDLGLRPGGNAEGPCGKVPGPGRPDPGGPRVQDGLRYGRMPWVRHPHRVGKPEGVRGRPCLYRG